MSEDETTPSAPGTPSRTSSPGWTAWKIVSGPGTAAERGVKLKELAKQFPNDQGVTGYFESLNMQKELEK